MSLRLGILSGLLLAGGAASIASATPVNIQSAGIYQPGTINITGPALNQAAYATAVDLVANQSGTPVTLYAFCIDLFHSISTGIDSNHDIVTGAGDAQASATLNYHTATLTLDSNGPSSGTSGQSLTAVQVGEIGGLADLGRGLIIHDVSDLSRKLAGIQGAIWAIEYAPSGYTVTSADPTVQGYISNFVADAGQAGFQRPAVAIFADNGATQGFVLGVPEPVTWAMMVLGMGAIGVSLRQKPRARAIALA